MKRRLVILTEIIAPYRIPLFNDLAQRAEVDLHVVFLAETDPGLRQWQVYKDEIRFSYQVLPSWRRHIGKYNALLNHGVSRALTDAAPDAILCGGYSYVASWQSLIWARLHSIPFFLWAESTQQDRRRRFTVVELLKTEFLRQCTGFVVPGQAARDYLHDLQIDGDRIFVAPNAVDNDLFSQAAAAARRNATALRKELALSKRYFLFSGRLVLEKGVFELLAAYKSLDDSLRHDVGLVFAGDGVCRQQLEAEAATISPGKIRFVGFAQRDQLASYYALAEMLVLPTYTDTWGLVVNEAMACGLPIILSSVAGCAVDLIRENWNGISVPRRDVPALARAMQRLASQPDLSAAMGANSAQHISRHSPKEWSEGIMRMMEVSGAARD